MTVPRATTSPRSSSASSRMTNPIGPTTASRHWRSTASCAGVMGCARCLARSASCAACSITDVNSSVGRPDSRAMSSIPRCPFTKCMTRQRLNGRGTSSRSPVGQFGSAASRARVVTFSAYVGPVRRQGQSADLKLAGAFHQGQRARYPSLLHVLTVGARSCRLRHVHLVVLDDARRWWRIRGQGTGVPCRTGLLARPPLPAQRHGHHVTR